MTWNQAGQVTQHSYGTASTAPAARWLYNSVTLRLTQDAFGTNSWITRDRANSYVYDDNGNITSIREIRNSNQYQCFTYDQIDRLLTAYTDNTSACNGHTAVGQGNFNDTYTYSRGGDLTSHTGTGEGSQRGTYTYGDPNLAHAVTAINDGSTFAYDDNGNMTLRNLAGQPAQTLMWDEGRRLDEVRQGASVVEEYLYGLDDVRVRTKTGDDYEFYASDGTRYSFDAATNTGYFTYYHQINGRTVAFTRGDTGETTWMGSDIVNSTAVTSDENGVVNTQRYTPFGELRNNGGLDTDRLYTGQVFDEATGLAFYNARYYDPAIGRFTSPDSIVPNPSNGQDYNRYSYVRNNPIRWNDPTGNVYECFTDSCGMDFSNLDDQIGQSQATGRTIHEQQVAASCNPTFNYNGSCGAAAPGTTSCSDFRCAAERTSLVPFYGVDTFSDIYLCGDSLFGSGSGWDVAADCGGLAVPVVGAGWIRRMFGVPGSAVDDLAAAACRSNSFVPGTEVLMADGTTKPIEDVEVGERVWAHDPETGETGPRPVIDTIVGDGHKQLVDIEVLGDTITATDQHPFWVTNDGAWIDADDLEVGDQLLVANGALISVIAVGERSELQRVHNLTVAGIHTYYVSAGDEQVLVHNCIRGTQGLEHSFDRHAAQWFGRDVARSTHMDEWTALLERASGSSQSFDWSVGNDLTTAHLATIDNKPFVVQFFQEGPRAGEVATAFVPTQSQLTQMYAALGG